MFKSKTLFIVGAGASREAGLPTGTQLTDAIANKLSFEFLNGSWVEGAGNADIHDAIRQHASRNNLPEGDLFRAASKICDAMPQAPSIDHFLHTHSTDQ